MGGFILSEFYFTNGDCLNFYEENEVWNEIIEGLHNDCHPGIRTWVFDPPYNIGYDYGGVIKDKNDSYFEDMKSMCEIMKRNSKYNANLFLIIYINVFYNITNIYYIYFILANLSIFKFSKHCFKF